MNPKRLVSGTIIAPETGFQGHLIHFSGTARATVKSTTIVFRRIRLGLPVNGFLEALFELQPIDISKWALGYMEPPVDRFVGGEQNIGDVCGRGYSV